MLSWELIKMENTMSFGTPRHSITLIKQHNEIEPAIQIGWFYF